MNAAAVYFRLCLVMLLAGPVYVHAAVNSVIFETIASPLDTNPNAGAGVRIFPDKRSPTDVTNRRRVGVAANTTFGTGVRIFFRSFDLDDPSANSSPLDANGSSGSDNRGTPLAGTLSAASALTNSNGVARVEFMVTTQPGNNFTVVASANQAYLNRLTVTGINVRDANGTPLPTNTAKAAPMLTVWRSLHIEVDSMGRVTGNKTTGQVTLAQPGAQPNTTLITTNKSLERSRFERGRLTIGGTSYPVITNNATQVTIQGVVSLTGMTFTLVDDDDFNNNDGAFPDGDEGENVTRPNTSLLQTSDDPAKNVFAPAYVRPLYDVGDNNDFVPFVLNSPSENPAALQASYDFDAKGTADDSGFWTVYILGGYQYVTSQDNDPGTEPATPGIVDEFPLFNGISGQGIIVFTEILRSSETTLSMLMNSATTTAHELGHLFNGRHSDGGLMALPERRTTTRFSDITLNEIRKINYP